MEPHLLWATQQPTNAAPVVSVQEHEQQLFSKYSTLEEPVLETVLRDVRAVTAKLKVVLQPIDYSSRLLSTVSYTRVETSDPSQEPSVLLTDHDKSVLQKLKDWDLWGPLVLCLSLAVLLSFRSPPGQAALVFAALFCAVWVGGTVVTINAQLLGGTISFFQCLCVLGYSIFPLTIAALVLGVLKMLFRGTWMWLDMIVVGASCVWAMRVSAVFIALYIKPERRLLALYPVLFYYTFLAWMILLF